MPAVRRVEEKEHAARGDGGVERGGLQIARGGGEGEGKRRGEERRLPIGEGGRHRSGCSQSGDAVITM